MKIKAQLFWAVFLPGILALTGCTTVNTAADAKGSGEQVVYKAPFEAVWTATPTVITNVGLRLVSTNDEKHVFLAKHGISGWSWGENVAIFVEKVETNKTSVEVVTKRKLVTNITAQEWDEPIFIQLDRMFKRD
jgi:uncharacterized lipoprotein